MNEQDIKKEIKNLQRDIKKLKLNLYFLAAVFNVPLEDEKNKTTKGEK